MRIVCRSGRRCRSNKNRSQRSAGHGSPRSAYGPSTDVPDDNVSPIKELSGKPIGPPGRQDCWLRPRFGINSQACAEQRPRPRAVGSYSQVLEVSIPAAVPVVEPCLAAHANLEQQRTQWSAEQSLHQLVINSFMVIFRPVEPSLLTIKITYAVPCREPAYGLRQNLHRHGSKPCSNSDFDARDICRMIRRKILRATGNDQPVTWGRITLGNDSVRASIGLPICRAVNLSRWKESSNRRFRRKGWRPHFGRGREGLGIGRTLARQRPTALPAV